MQRPLKGQGHTYVPYAWTPTDLKYKPDQLHLSAVMDIQKVIN